MKILSHIDNNGTKYSKLLYLYMLFFCSSFSFRPPSLSNKFYFPLTQFSDYPNSKRHFSVNLFYKDGDSLQDKYLITSPLFYLNGDPHLGHAYTLVAADVLKRYLVLSGYNAKLLVGTDEHGSKIKSTSTKLGYNPKDYVLSMRKRFSELYSGYDISPDIVIHTSEDEHKSRVKATFEDFLKSDLIYRDLHRGYFSPKEDLYYTKSKLVNGKSPLGFDVVIVDEPAYFFRINRWKDILGKFFDENPDIISPNHRLNEIKNILNSQLNDMAITRSNCDWGIQVGEKETIYVWFDALLGYLTHLKRGENGYSGDDRKVIHVLGKDILSFHAILWPAMLMSLKLKLPSKFLVHGWLLVKGEKISKSLGNSISALPTPQSSDVSRLALMNLGDFRYDFEFDSSVFDNSLNLIRNKFANTCYRITSILSQNNIKLLEPLESYSNKSENFDDSVKLLNKFKDYSRDIDEHVKSFRLDKYIQVILEMSSEINAYISEKQFWLTESHCQDFLKTSWTACSLLFYLSLYLMPITPKLSNDIISRIRPTLYGQLPSTLSFKLLDNIGHYSYRPVHLKPLI